MSYDCLLNINLKKRFIRANPSLKQIAGNTSGRYVLFVPSNARFFI